jgi:hypothetical protein
MRNVPVHPWNRADSLLEKLEQFRMLIELVRDRVNSLKFAHVDSSQKCFELYA